MRVVQQPMHGALTTRAGQQWGSEFLDPQFFDRHCPKLSIKLKNAVRQSCVRAASIALRRTTDSRSFNAQLAARFALHLTPQRCSSSPKSQSPKPELRARRWDFFLRYLLPWARRQNDPSPGFGNISRAGANNKNGKTNMPMSKTRCRYYIGTKLVVVMLVLTSFCESFFRSRGLIGAQAFSTVYYRSPKWPNQLREALCANHPGTESRDLFPSSSGRDSQKNVCELVGVECTQLLASEFKFKAVELGHSSDDEGGRTSRDM